MENTRIPNEIYGAERNCPYANGRWPGEYTDLLRPEGGLTNTMGPWELVAKEKVAEEGGEYVPSTPTEQGSHR